MFDWQHEMWNREWKSPRNGDKGRWYLPDEETFLQTIHTLKGEYGVPIVGSPGHVGLEVLREIHKEQGKKIKPLPMRQKYDFQQRAKNMCNWICWSEWTNRKPGLSDKNKRKRRIVGYDKNGQFLGASQSVELGDDGYVETEEFNPLFTGFWEYELLDVSDSLFNGEDLPCPLDRVKGIAHSDLILCCMSRGLDIRIGQGIIWQESDRYLSRWAKEMWQHRVNMRKIEDAIIRRNCEGTAKHIPNSLVGRLVNEYSVEYFHPDWNKAIVHRSVTNLIYTLNKIQRDYNITPILVSKDALYFATDEQDISLVVPGMLEHQFEQRGWKPIGMCEMNGEIVAAFSTGKVGVIEQLIKKEMKSYGLATTV